MLALRSLPLGSKNLFPKLRNVPSWLTPPCPTELLFIPNYIHFPLYDRNLQWTTRRALSNTTRETATERCGVPVREPLAHRYSEETFL